MRRWPSLAALVCLLAPALPAGAEPALPTLPALAPDVSGVLVVSTSSATEDDPRLGRLAARFAVRQLESFVASDSLRPPPDPERALVHARWRLDDARRARRLRRYALAAAAGDEAIRVIETNAFAREHLDLLVEALIERGATALDTGDPATAETVFLAALSIDPLREVDAELHGPALAQVFSDVRRAARELRFGSLRVEVPALPGATVSIDFGAPQDPPVTANLPDGRHFVSVTAPARHEVVSYVPVRAERATELYVRPPLSGDVRARAHVLQSFTAADAPTVRTLAATSGLRFVAGVAREETGLALTLFDGKTGSAVPGGDVTLSLDPGPDEVDAAVTRVLAAAMKVEPRLDPETMRPGWYTRWWGIALIGVAVAGAATAAALYVQSRSPTEYTFEN